MNKFFNHFEQKYENCCAELAHTGRWYIRLGFAGANCYRNNRDGFKTKEQAEKMCLNYQQKG